jgi:hypothetical protein
MSRLGRVTGDRQEYVIQSRLPEPKFAQRYTGGVHTTDDIRQL